MNSICVTVSDDVVISYQNGVKHALDGPAVEYANGNREWWIDGKQYSKEEFNELTDKIPYEDISYTELPTVVEKPAYTKHFKGNKHKFMKRK